MLGHRQLSFEEYLEILRRRLWILVVPAVLGAVGAYAYSLTVPDRYTSQTLVLVQQQKVPDAFVKSVVTEELNQRLGTMREQILSRSRLEPLIENHKLFTEEDKKLYPLEDLVDRLRRAISVTPVQPVPGAGRSDTLPGFYVSFTWSDPRIAQQVCQQITSMFMEENLKFRAARADQTTKFLDAQLEEAKKNLDQQDARLAQIKQRYLGQLPGQEEMNLNILMGLNTQLDTVTQQLNRAMQDKTFAENELARQLAQLAAQEASEVGTDPLALEKQLAAWQSELIRLEARYTPDHPDVVKMKADIARLQRKIDEVTSATAAPVKKSDERVPLNEPAELQQLRAQVRQHSQTIQEKTREQARLQREIKVYQSRVQLSPVVEQQFKEANRDYEVALNHYNDLLSKRTTSEMAKELELQQQGEQFQVMDAPNLPETPNYPDRPLFAMGGFGVGLLLGAGISLLLEMRDKSIRSERDIEALLGLPVLAMVPTADATSGGGRFWKRPPSRAANSTLQSGA